jgi:hypothetical protein
MGEYPIEEAAKMITLGSVLWQALAVVGGMAVVSVALAALIAIAPRLTTRPLRKDLEIQAARTGGHVPTGA